MAISHDSLKHSIIYQTIYDILTKSLPFILEKDLSQIRSEINNHVEIEKDMLKTVKELLEKVDDSRKKLLLEAIYHDEIIHHRLLINIYEIIGKLETLSEDKLWDMLWKDSSFHGTPGG